jgi:hypothetical protein
MARTDLRVPFAEKDEAKRLGAKWDPSAKVWYAPDGIDLVSFERWLPQDATGTLSAPSYSLARSEKSCWKCGDRTEVFCILLPAGFNKRQSGTADWIPVRSPAFLSYLTLLSQPVDERIKTLAPGYRMTYSAKAGRSYWMNHCQRCDIKQGDFDLHCEPNGAFLPLDPTHAQRISLLQIQEAFEGSAEGISNGVDFLHCMPRQN